MDTLKSRIALLFFIYLALVIGLQIYPNDTLNTFFNHYEKIIFWFACLVPFLIGCIFRLTIRKEVGKIILKNSFWVLLVLTFSFWFKP